MFSVYVLYSPKYQKIYIGYTSDLENRLRSHNELASKGWTVRFRPWQLLFSEHYTDEKRSLEREKSCNVLEGRDGIWNVIKNVQCTVSKLHIRPGRTPDPSARYFK